MLHRLSVLNLAAPYCAIPRDYLSDTLLLRAMGFLVSQHGQMGAIPPSPFSERFLESMRSGGAIPPLKEGISAILARPYENKANGCNTIRHENITYPKKIFSIYFSDYRFTISISSN